MVNVLKLIYRLIKYVDFKFYIDKNNIHIYIALIQKRYISIEIFRSSSQTKTMSSTKLTSLVETYFHILATPMDYGACQRLFQDCTKKICLM